MLQKPRRITSSNNTNKFNPQEQGRVDIETNDCSNNTNKFNPQEQRNLYQLLLKVQIIQINSILKNLYLDDVGIFVVQIIQINSILKNL